MAEFLSMGGYGLYVWGSYGFSAVVLILNLVYARKAHSIAKRMVEELKKANENS